MSYGERDQCGINDCGRQTDIDRAKAGVIKLADNDTVHSVGVLTKLKYKIEIQGRKYDVKWWYRI